MRRFRTSDTRTMSTSPQPTPRPPGGRTSRSEADRPARAAEPWWDDAPVPPPVVVASADGRTPAVTFPPGADPFSAGGVFAPTGAREGEPSVVVHPAPDAAVARSARRRGVGACDTAALRLLDPGPDTGSLVRPYVSAVEPVAAGDERRPARRPARARAATPAPARPVPAVLDASSRRRPAAAVARSSSSSSPPLPAASRWPPAPSASGRRRGRPRPPRRCPLALRAADGAADPRAPWAAPQRAGPAVAQGVAGPGAYRAGAGPRARAPPGRLDGPARQPFRRSTRWPAASSPTAPPGAGWRRAECSPSRRSAWWPRARRTRSRPSAGTCRRIPVTPRRRPRSSASQGPVPSLPRVSPCPAPPMPVTLSTWP